MFIINLLLQISVQILSSAITDKWYLKFPYSWLGSARHLRLLGCKFAQKIYLLTEYDRFRTSEIMAQVVIPVLCLMVLKKHRTWQVLRLGKNATGFAPLK